MTYKIVRTDNYDRETRAEALVCEGIADERLGLVMVAALREDPRRPTDDWYSLVDADHVLWRGMVELV
jgi:hypothetical protein